MLRSGTLTTTKRAILADSPMYEAIRLLYDNQVKSHLFPFHHSNLFFGQPIQPIYYPVDQRIGFLELFFDG